MRRDRRGAGLALLLALGAVPAGAAINGTPHDLVGQGYAPPWTGTQEDLCTPCHPGPSGGDGELFPAVPMSLGDVYDATALTCFSCHDGITLVAAEADASLTAFHPAGHRGPPAGLTAQEAAEDDAGGKGLSGECSSCHDPHQNRNRPFLRSPLATLCPSCHAIFSELPSSQGNQTGSHPVGIDPLKAPRRDVPIAVGPAFRVPMPSSYPLQRGRGATGTHWDLGGHLAGGAVGEVACATCHAVHGDEERPPAAGLLVVDPVGQAADLLCEGCHRGARGDGTAKETAPNPGGTTSGRTYHPCDDDEANGPGRSPQIRTPPGWPFGAGQPPRLLCTTCHVVHRAEAGTLLLRPAAVETGFCGECHEAAPSVYHHPTGISTGPCGTMLATATGASETKLTCDVCHRAHNAGLGTGREADYVPMLRTSLAENDFCTPCHPAANPVCAEDRNRMATHFMGDPTLMETYGNPNPPLRLTPWRESGLKSRYGGANGKAIGCLSCHSFQKGALVSGDDGTSRFQLARSGNEVEWAEEEEGTYLCTGCHGTSPGTAVGEQGHTHPLMNARIPQLGNPVTPPVSGTPSGRMNCDSCHRAHSAHTPSGAYILEVVEGQNQDPSAIKPGIVFTPLCYGCHTSGNY